MRPLLAFALLACCGTVAPVTPRVDASPDAADVAAPTDVAPADSGALDGPPEAAVDAPELDAAPLCVPGTPTTCDCPDGSRRGVTCVDGRPMAPCPCEAPDAAMEAAVDAVVVDAPADVALEAACASSTPGNCCGVACPMGAGVAMATCTAGRCGFVCTTGRGDCNGVAADGCEVNTTATSAHCGTCGASCAVGLVCSDSACVTSCRAGLRMCPDGCRDLMREVANCGSCGRVCDRVCVDGRCV